ncbi:MAG: type I-U CRISPR-associated protein Cas7 [Pirellula sp.]|nr:type I-U CRISPR-associated protein Cas7 [Pirellula sp.]
MTKLESFDNYLSDDGPAALVLKQPLMPVDGEDGILFPATYAEGKGFAGGYNIDEVRGQKVALIDSVGSQANRIEPMFIQEEYRHLVPQVVITAGDKQVNLLEAGHRAGDAIIRSSSLHDEIQAAFKSVLKGDAMPLAKIAPTSLVFGVWDSRDTQAKLPRVIASSIRAYNVHKLTRSAVYTPPINYASIDVFTEEDKQKAEGDEKNPLSKWGYVNALASGSHGGVIAEGGVLRTATLGLAAVRLIHGGMNKTETLKLRRYILGLSLVAFTYHASNYLRQGCMLVVNPNKQSEFTEMPFTGVPQPCSITHEIALRYATVAADAFVVGKSKTVPFDKEKAKKEVKGEVGGKVKGKKGKKTAEASAEEGTDDV